jgi:hypothetical protein
MKCRNKKLCKMYNPHTDNKCCYTNLQVRNCEQRKLFNRIMSDWKKSDMYIDKFSVVPKAMFHTKFNKRLEEKRPNIRKN